MTELYLRLGPAGEIRAASTEPLPEGGAPVTDVPDDFMATFARGKYRFQNGRIERVADWQASGSEA